MANGVKEQLVTKIEGTLNLNDEGEEITVTISEEVTSNLRDLLKKLNGETVKINVTYVNEIVG